jgi:hypothetical protein
VWGGYFPTQHTDTVLRSTFVDFVIRSQGEQPLLQLIDVLRSRRILNGVAGLSWKAGSQIVHNPTGPPADLNELPDLPYHRVDMTQYLHKNYLGRKTVAYNSSFGCPFACSFCAVVSMSNRRWLAQSPARIEGSLRHLVSTYGVDAVQMHDMDFFISEARTAEFAERIDGLGIRWWALGRVDTLMQYSDATWRKMARSGLKMVFSGAESASDATLAAMNKGGQSSAQLTLDLARRMRAYGVIPEFSFVSVVPDRFATLLPPSTSSAGSSDQPSTEILHHTPVPLDGRLYAEASAAASRFRKRSRTGRRPSGNSCRCAAVTASVDVGRGPATGAQLRACHQRVLPDGHRSPPHTLAPGRTQVGQCVAVRAEVLRRSARAAGTASRDALSTP